MTLLFERLRLEAHLTGLCERMGPVIADRVVLDALERYWASQAQTVLEQNPTLPAESNAQTTLEIGTATR
jgi:hypothetical protein